MKPEEQRLREEFARQSVNDMTAHVARNAKGRPPVEVVDLRAMSAHELLELCHTGLNSSQVIIVSVSEMEEFGPVLHQLLFSNTNTAFLPTASKTQPTGRYRSGDQPWRKASRH